MSLQKTIMKIVSEDGILNAFQELWIFQRISHNVIETFVKISQHLLSFKKSLLDTIQILNFLKSDV